MNDVELLNQHRGGSETAFADIVRRHVGWIYGMARRRLRDSGLAEDVTQSVFIVLHRKSPRFAADGAMIRWLHKTAWYATETTARRERRRKLHETEAAMMRADSSDSAALESSSDDPWQELAPLLDTLIEQLPQSDREAILLRYYRDLSFSEVGAELGTTEEAARKRVARAVEKLRHFAGKKNLNISTSAMLSCLARQIPTTPPPGLIARVTTAAGAPYNSPLSSSAGPIFKGIILMSASSKLSIAVVAFLAILACAGWAFFSSHDGRMRAVPLLPAAPALPSAKSYPHLAPYDGVRWKGHVPEVQYDGVWYERVAINGTPAPQIVLFSQKKFGNLWEKRFDEDLVEVLTDMGFPPGPYVRLTLRTLDTRAVEEVPHAAMTEKNRQAIWRSRNMPLSSG